MNPRSLAAEIVARCDREHPADAVVRACLREERGLDAAARAEVARTVFAYFRWLGWLEARDPIESRIQRALELAAQFARHPARMDAAELREKAVPGWVREFADVRPDWIESLQTAPRLWLRARRGEGAALAARLGDCRPSSPLADAMEYTGSRDLFTTPEFHTGEFEIQDIASQAVGWICHPLPGQAWWDACAGEGGKLLHLSSLMLNKGIVWASDRALWRLQHLRRRAARAGVFNYRSAPWDGGPRLPTRTLFDGVLLDAPCSGLGTWGRNPHARWTTTPSDVRELAVTQRAMLAAVAPAVKSGGRLVYAVCTITRAETEETAAAWERNHPDFERLALANPLQPGAPAAPALWLWPRDRGGNAMFVAAWRRMKKG